MWLQSESEMDVVARRTESTRLRGQARKTLSLGGMGLTALPESIGQLAQLKELKLASNKLMALHEAIVSSPSSPA